MRHLSWIFGFLTMPGAVFHAFAEHLLCKILRIPVEDTAYLHCSEQFGHVEHKPVLQAGKGFALCFVPGLILFLCGAVTAGTAAVQLFAIGVTPIVLTTGKVSALFIVCCVLLYAGICMLCHVFPSYEDALYLWESRDEASAAAKIILTPLAACMRAGAFLSRFGVWQILYAALTAVMFILF